MNSFKKYIEVSLGSYRVSHGYDENNNEIFQSFQEEGFAKKLVAVTRIKWVSEKYILTDYLDGRWVYWEYEEDYAFVKQMLFNM